MSDERRLCSSQLGSAPRRCITAPGDVSPLRVRRARDSAQVRELLAWLAPLMRHYATPTRNGTVHRLQRRAPAQERDYARGTHPLGEHVWHVIRTALACRPATSSPEQADALMRALADCLDLASVVPAASRPAAPPEHVVTGRVRMSLSAGPPMNLVQRHHGAGESQAPSAQLDSAHWLHEYQRVDDPHDRCEVVRRTAVYLAGLLDEPRACLKCHGAAALTLWDDDRCPLCGKESARVERAVEDEEQLRERIAIDAYGHPLRAAAERFDRRSVIQARLEHGHHPVRGVAWTPPEDNALAAHEARAMRDAGLTSTDIARALGRSANTIRSWTTRIRRAA